jgi:hypothetical protein
VLERITKPTVQARDNRSLLGYTSLGSAEIIKKFMTTWTHKSPNQITFFLWKRINMWWTSHRSDWNDELQLDLLTSKQTIYLKEGWKDVTKGTSWFSTLSHHNLFTISFLFEGTNRDKALLIFKRVVLNTFFHFQTQTHVFNVSFLKIFICFDFVYVCEGFTGQGGRRWRVLRLPLQDNLDSQIEPNGDVFDGRH